MGQHSFVILAFIEENKAVCGRALGEFRSKVLFFVSFCPLPFFLSNLIKISFQFKVDRLQIIVVAKKYISTCRNCSSVGCLKCVQFHNWFRLH